MRTHALVPGDETCRSLVAGIYIRKSTATEGKSKSREEQLEFAERDAQAFGFKEVRIYLEEEGQKGDWFWRDAAGRNPGPHRPELTRLVSDIQADEVQVVICYKVDRLVRSSEVMAGLRRVFKDKGVRLVAQGRDCELSTARGKYQNSIDAAVAEQWRDQISEDIKRDHDYKASRGLFSRNPSCFGFRSKGRESQAVEPIWSELDLVNRIFRMFLNGEDERGPLGIVAIANRLMDEGISLAVGAKGHVARNPGKVHASQIKTILTNCMYVARWRHNGVEYPCDRLLVEDSSQHGAKKTVVPIEHFEAAQLKLAQTPRRGTKSLTSSHLLSGLVICGMCGRPMHLNNKARKDGSIRRSYVCARKRGELPCPRGIPMIQETTLDDWVLTHLGPWLEAEAKVLKKLSEGHGSADDLANAERELEERVRVEGEQLAAIVGVLDPVQIAAVADRLRSERRPLEERVSKLKRKSRAATAGDPQGFDLRSMDRHFLKTVLRGAVDWIAVAPKGIVVKTREGMPIAGTLHRDDSHGRQEAAPRQGLAAPTPQTSSEGLLWLPNPEMFLRGRSLCRTRQAVDDRWLLGSLL